LDRDQDFLNYVALRDYKRAIELALSLSQPGRLFSLFKDVASENQTSSISGSTSVDEVVRTLVGSDLVKLLGYVRDWNANGKTSPVAQRILFAIFKLHPPDAIIHVFEDDITEKRYANSKPEASSEQHGGRTALKEMVEALIPYSERHLSRMTKLVQESYVIDYILEEMDGGMFDDQLTDTDEMQVD
jgi:U3 small nucleolar RNA-associated protein 13